MTLFHSLNITFVYEICEQTEDLTHRHGREAEASSSITMRYRQSPIFGPARAPALFAHLYSSLSVFFFQSWLITAEP